MGKGILYRTQGRNRALGVACCCAVLLGGVAGVLTSDALLVPVVSAVLGFAAGVVPSPSGSGSNSSAAAIRS